MARNTTPPPDEPTPDETPDEVPDTETGETTRTDDLAVSADQPEALAKVEDETPESVASPADNAALTHSDETSPTSTRTDATDVGVPMLPGSPSEPVGPEDALGEGPKRGDYSGRMGFSDYQPTTTEHIPDAKPGEPHTRVVSQRPNAENQGEVEGKKGGVTTSADDTPTNS